MKKILLVSASDPTDKRTWSGTEYSFFQQLKKYYYVEILTVNYPAARAIDKIFMRLFTLGKQDTGFGFVNSYVCSKRVYNKLRNHTYDAIFAFGPFHIAYLNTALPIVYFTDATVHSMQHYYWNFLQPLYWVADVIQRRCLQKSSVAVGASSWVVSDMVKYYGLAPQKCKLCQLGANVNVSDAQAIKEHDVINIVFVGAAWARKGGDIALDAFRQLKQIDGNHRYHFHVVGGKPEKKVDEEDVTFYGFLNRNIPEQEKLHSDIFKDGDIFLLPTRAECAGMVFCEASAYGLPIVTYDTGGISDYVVNGVNGYRLPIESGGTEFANKMLSIINDSDLRQRLSDGGKRLYKEHLNWDAAGQKIKEIIDSLL